MSVYVLVYESVSVWGCTAWGRQCRRRQNLGEESGWNRISCADDVSNWRESPTGMAWQLAGGNNNNTNNFSNTEKEQQIGRFTRLYRWLVSEVWILGIYLISSCLRFTLWASSTMEKQETNLSCSNHGTGRGLEKRRVKQRKNPKFWRCHFNCIVFCPLSYLSI